MHSHAKHLTAAVIIAAGSPLMSHAETSNNTEANKQLVQAAFDRWRAGTGNPFELLADDATWTITGNSAASKTYETKEAFMEAVIRPFAARVSKPLVPTMRNLYADGDTVIALFDAETMAKDGKPYRNSYAWFMQMRDGKMIKVTAFYDSLAFDDLWKRVPVTK